MRKNWNCEPAVGGDISAWDASWSNATNALSAALDQAIFGPEYMKLGPEHLPTASLPPPGYVVRLMLE